MTEPKAKVIHYTKIEAQPAGPDAPGSSIRWIIDEEHDGAPHCVLRVIEVEPGGHTPDHTHPFEHENFVLEGRGKVLIEDLWQDLSPGDVIFVPAGTRHSYANAGDTTFKFLCTIPASHLIPKG